MNPMGAGLESPAEVTGKLAFIVESRGVRRKNGSEESLAGCAGVTGAAANREAELIRIGEAVGKVPRAAAGQERIVDALAIGMKLGAGGGRVKCIRKTTD